MISCLEAAQIAVAVALPSIGLYLVAVLFSVRTNTAWAENLKQSSLTPPKWVFRVVWPILYSSMGYASYLVWRDGSGFTCKNSIPLMFYAGQLVLNWAWPPLFFRAHCIKAALVDMLVLLIVATGCGCEFYAINSLAGWLIAPYVCWLCFATFLNLRIVQLNPDLNKMFQVIN